LLHQDGNAAGQQLVQKIAIRRAEIRQRMVIHRHVSADPLIHHMIATQAVQFTGAADAPQRSIEPQRHQDLGVRGRASYVAFDRIDLLVQQSEIQPLNIIPNQSRRVTLRQQIVQGNGTICNLFPIRTPHSRLAAPHSFGVWWFFYVARFARRQLEQNSLRRTLFRGLVRGFLAHGLLLAPGEKSVQYDVL
jgi:hypothetical protein